MARFTPQTKSAIFRRMANRVVARSNLTDLEAGGELWTILEAAADEFDTVNYQMITLQTIWSINDATGRDLDARVAVIPEADITRLGPMRSVGSVVFGRAGTVGTVNIPAGTVVRVPNGPQFRTTALGTILNGNTTSASVPIEALVPGAAGNVDAGAISALEAVTGAETVTNAAPTTTGQDEETDEQLRTRALLFIRGLPRGTQLALQGAVLGASLTGFGRVTSAEVLRLPPPDEGRVRIWIDNGSGTVATINTTAGPETVVASASGGEDRLFTDFKPLIPNTTIVLEKNASPLNEGVDYYIDRPRGQIDLVVPLAPTDTLTIEYSYYGGLIAEAQKIINGDPADRVNYPGFAAYGDDVAVLPPLVLQQSVEGSVILDEGFSAQRANILESIKNAIARYINGLGVNGDIIVSELVFVAQSITGVRDVEITQPSANVIIGSGQLARIVPSNIDLT